MRYLSVCSGIEAASVAWHELGWAPTAFAEIDPFPCAVLEHRFAGVRNLGDFTTIQPQDLDAPADILVGGTPCQSFSVAGRRAGLDDPRGVLALEFLALARRLRTRWLVWENVPGVLHSNGGRDLGAFLWELGQLGYGWSYRVLDAQYFGVPQRRRRVFLVGYLGDWRPAAAVLLERACLRGDPAPSREAGESAPTIPSRRSAGGGMGADFDCDGGLIAFDTTQITSAENRCQPKDGDPCHPLAAEAHAPTIVHTLRADGFDASEDGTGRGTPLVAHTLSAKGGSGRSDGESETFIPVAFDLRGREGGAMLESVGGTVSVRAANGGSSRSYIASDYKSGAFEETETARGLTTSADRTRSAPVVAGTVRGHCRNNSNPATEAAMHVRQGMAIRRLTPRECERLQGFPDDWTLVPYRGKPAADGPRYRAIGNSMAVPVVAWLGRRIGLVERVMRAGSEPR